MGLTDAAKVSEEHRTISSRASRALGSQGRMPSPTPTSLSARWIAEVPETRAVASYVPSASANSFSNVVTFGPRGAVYERFVSAE
jgi:hypothetical protein